MEYPLSQEIQEACYDLYHSPLDLVAQANVRGLLLQEVATEDEREFAREIRLTLIALRHQPDLDTRRVLLALLDPALAMARLDAQRNFAA